MGDEKHWKFISDMMGMHIVSNSLHMDPFAPVV